MIKKLDIFLMYKDSNCNHLGKVHWAEYDRICAQSGSSVMDKSSGRG